MKKLSGLRTSRLKTPAFISGELYGCNVISQKNKRWAVGSTSEKDISNVD